MQKNNEAGISLNAVECEPVERVPKARTQKIFFGLKFFFFQNFNFYFIFLNFSNFHERSEIGWREIKTKFQVFPIFIVRAMALFCDDISSPQFSMIFRDNSKNKNRRFFLLFFPDTHSVSFIKFSPLLRKEGGGA